MLPESLPQLIDTPLRRTLLEAAQLRELIQHLPDPQTAAEEMLHRGWITQNQFSSLFPDPQQRSTPRKTMLDGFGDDESPPDADCEDWSLPLGDEDDNADVPSEVETALAVPVRESDMDTLPRQGMGWASKGLLMGTLFLGSLFAGLPFFAANSTVPKGARQDPPKAGDLPLMPNPINVAIAKQYEDVIKRLTQNTQSAAPVTVPPAVPVVVETPVTAPAPAWANDAQPKSRASLYERVRQAVLENKTEETERLGMGDFAYQDVPADGSIMVGMEVSYAPFFTHNVIKSVRPIYQDSDGRRYDGAVCGSPTGVSERVVAKEGYAIGGAAIKSGMGIDGMQFTFMEIGADGLNPNKTYLSKWLGGYGGSHAKTFVNDGRPIVGIAGMRSKLNFGPAFCLCLVTTKAGAIADADGQKMMQTQRTAQVAPLNPQDGRLGSQPGLARQR